MDDLMGRIAQQNQEKALENSQRGLASLNVHDREASLRAEEANLRGELGHYQQAPPPHQQQYYQPPPHQQQYQQPPQQYQYQQPPPHQQYQQPPQQHPPPPPHYQQPPPQQYQGQPPPQQYQGQPPPQQYQGQPPPQQYQGQPPPQYQPQHQPPAQAPLTEEMLRSQERELDRQLKAERARAATARVPPPSTRGGAAQPGKENRARSSIPLMPPGTGAPPPSTGRPEALRRPVHFSHTMVKEGTTQMNDFLKPTGGIRDEMRKAGVQPKDHVRENRRMLHGLATQKAIEREQKEQVELERRAKEHSMRERATAQAQQQVMPEGPSAGRRSVRQPQGPAPPPRDPAAGRHEPGAVPAYLQRRKAEWAAEADAEAERRAMEAQCPPGLRLVGAEEKAGILGTLMGEKEKAEAALLQLPFVIKTNATQKKKDQLEARLLEIDGAVAAYSKEKVLVPIDA